jgi:hypothetical protein
VPRGQRDRSLQPYSRISKCPVYTFHIVLYVLCILSDIVVNELGQISKNGRVSFGVENVVMRTVD